LSERGAGNSHRGGNRHGHEQIIVLHHAVLSLPALEEKRDVESNVPAALRMIWSAHLGRARNVIRVRLCLRSYGEEAQRSARFRPQCLDSNQTRWAERSAATCQQSKRQRPAASSSRWRAEEARFIGMGQIMNPTSSRSTSIEMEENPMPRIRSGYGLSTRRSLLGALLAALFALVLFDSGAATAQTKQIKLTEQQVQGFITVFNDMMKIYEGADPDKPDAKRDAQAEALAKKNGFKSLDEYDAVSDNITTIMLGIDPQTKKFTEPPDQIKQDIEALRTDKSVSDVDKRKALAQLQASLKIAKPIQFKENIALVLKYFDKLSPLLQT
jgi:hypothetical protein